MAVGVVIVLLFAGLAVRLAVLQVGSRDRYVSVGEEQRVRSELLPADRGSIVDRNGEDLALSLSQPTLWADPSQVHDPVAAAAALAPILGVDQIELIEKLGSDSQFAYLARQVPEPVADQAMGLELAGVYTIDEPARFTPSGEVARSLLGRVGVDHVGISGIELQYDEVMAGEAGELTLERDPAGNTIAAGQYSLQPAAQGDDLELTIDRALQWETERVLAAQVDEVGAAGGIAVISDPRTGEVLAMANVETGEDGTVAPTSNNLALTTVFEPGSINKVITVAAALEEGIVDPGTVFEVPDSLQVSDHEFTDSDPHATAAWSVRDIIVNSSNVGTIKIAQQLGGHRLDGYLRRFGFGTATELAFPNEVAGLMLDLESWSGTSIGSIPLGQGISVTAMQMLAAYNVIAAGGTYVPPRMVSASIDSAGERHEPETAEPVRVVSETTAAQVSAMLVDVVREGTGTNAAIDGYTVAGKTGTARKPLETGGYGEDEDEYRYVATFAGFVPAEAPQLSLIVVLDEPSASIYGGAVSAPVFADLARFALRLFRIPPAATTPVVAG